MTTTPNLFRYRHRCVYAVPAVASGPIAREANRNRQERDGHVNHMFSPVKRTVPAGVRTASFLHDGRCCSVAAIQRKRAAYSRCGTLASAFVARLAGRRPRRGLLKATDGGHGPVRQTFGVSPAKFEQRRRRCAVSSNRQALRKICVGG